jgi:hypothetical protein
MQVELKPKAAYIEKSQKREPTVRTDRAAVQAARDKGILDTVSLSSKTSKKSGPVGGSMDRVNLTARLSIDDVNRFLQSEVGKKVKGMFEDANIDIAQVADTDWSPEAVADRIFTGSTGLFGVWRNQHPEMSETELIDSFENVLRTSVDWGAAEAVGLISARNFDGEDALLKTADDTISLVHKKFDDYFAGLRERLSESASDGPSV